uniref:uncharacterized protein LOC122601170 n=1 Tax=Erigeron canadensis TaxID=72917 RepID=UPI001CB9C6F5|nr:uncharacterized protein LOC122601170 [Erigeron canadensis]
MSPQKEPLYHSLHPLHSLSRTSCLDYDILLCDVCGQELIFDTCHRCEPCKFVVCSKCVMAEKAQKDAATALKEELVIKFVHDGHNPQHTLTIQSRPAAFHCNACNTKKEDMFYQCDQCDFWIHKACTSLLETIDLPYLHHHKLDLVFSLPEKFYNYKYKCELCDKRIMQTDWTYHCSNCRYFIHIKCVPNSDQPSTQRLEVNVEEEATDSNILHLPMSHALTDPLKLLHSNNDPTTPGGGGDDNEQLEISHWSHDHLLFLTDVPQGDKINMPDIGCSTDPIMVCHICVRPLSIPYYSCKHDGCSFTLHKYCAELSRTLEHPLHPDHLLELVKQNYASLCYFCDKRCNTFMFQCKTCSFCIDVNCAFLPKIIKHKFHKQHPLVQRIGRLWKQCITCERRIIAGHYSCDACNVRLDWQCALRSPRLLPHRYCKGHEIPLTYPPIEDHPDDFYCEICEEDMYPKLPLYYCGKCKNSFHMHCLSREYKYENYVLEGTLSIPDHNHPLTYVRRKKVPKEVCFGCNGDINGLLFLECRSGNCPYCLCLECLPSGKRP